MAATHIFYAPMMEKRDSGGWEETEAYSILLNIDWGKGELYTFLRRNNNLGQKRRDCEK